MGYAIPGPAGRRSVRRGAKQARRQRHPCSVCASVSAFSVFPGVCVLASLHETVTCKTNKCSFLIVVLLFIPAKESNLEHLRRENFSPLSRVLGVCELSGVGAGN